MFSVCWSHAPALDSGDHLCSKQEDDVTLIVQQQDLNVQSLYRATLLPSRGGSDCFRACLGLNVDYTLERPDLRISAITGGLAEEWNRSASSSDQFEVGDSIIEINSAYGPAEMLELCRSQEMLDLVMRKKSRFPQALGPPTLEGFRVALGATTRTGVVAERLRSVTGATDIQMLHAPRPGVRLLVLDLDLTLFEWQSNLSIEQCKRPFTDGLLEACYPFFDLCIWSATKWTWVEAKLTELGLLTHAEFKISFCMDRSSMVNTTTYDSHWQPLAMEEVKPLEIIWERFPTFGPHNTVHVDDLCRNFYLNQRSGIEVSPWHAKSRGARTDDELQLLTTYLLSLVAAPNLSEIDHSIWRKQFA